MKHPLAGKAIIFYVTAWVAVIAAHAVFLYSSYGFPLSISLADAAISNVILAGIGLSYWYVVQYVSPEGQGVFGVVISHVLGVTVSALLVVYGANVALSGFFSTNANYLTLVTESFVWRIIVDIFYLTLIVMVYYLLRYNSNLLQKEQEEIQLQGMLRHSELEMLKFQINPHFIFNSLNSVSSLTITDPDKARDMVIKLSDFLRSSLGSQSPEKHLLKDELAQMQLYLDIEKVRFGERLSAVHEIDPACANMTLPNMILQPIYENAIKYGIYEQLEEVEISTVCKCEDGNLKISVSNNYDSEGVPQKGKGIGLKNVSNRLELTYGILGLMTIEKSKTIFTVHLLIPQTSDK
ncbi:histidine kinase [Fulvivirga sp. 29W222]|uniref:Histidine kinase n=1 Tax=Fulvivirga marina TaxID=2494733 RepID=A0A937FU35_9BACT|nr:histidine kinase [Fulvivirga marina]MBL6446065.1 histidine kinase [Fulvivirga marina]